MLAGVVSEATPVATSILIVDRAGFVNIISFDAGQSKKAKPVNAFNVFASDGGPDCTSGAAVKVWTLVVNPEGEKVLPERVNVTIMLCATLTVYEAVPELPIRNRRGELSRVQI